MTEALRIVIASLSIFAALGIACAAWLALRGSRGIGRRVSASSPVDPYSCPFGEMPIVPRERLMIAGDFRSWGIPKSTLKPSACALPRMNESGGRPESKFHTGTAVVLHFPRVQP